MSHDHTNDNLLPPNPDAQKALTALARLPRSQASETARERARLAFQHGVAPAVGRPAVRRPSRRWMGLLMAAALGVLAVFIVGSMPTEEWVVLDIVNPDAVVAPSDGTLAVGMQLAAGRVVTGPESEMEVQLGSSLRFRMMPGTALELPRPPGRWFGRSRRLPLTSGEIYGTTGGRKLGFDLAFESDELRANLVGTTFALFRTDEASCVCLWEGGIVVTPLVGSEAAITLDPQQRVWVYKDGRQPEILPLSDMERMKLQMTQDAGIAP